MRKTSSSSGAKAAVKTLADFRAAHDPNVIIPSRIRAQLERMRKEHEESWEYEQDFLRKAGVSNNYIGAFRDMFAEHIVETQGKHSKRVWFASPAVAAKAREPFND